MRCPSCDQELIVNGQERLETLDEHVLCAPTISCKDRYVCTNQDCVLKPENHCWNEYGEYYYMPPADYRKLDQTAFIDGLKCARGTLARQAEREFDDSDDERIPITKGRWKGWTKIIEVRHTADTDGNILKSTKQTNWITPEGIRYVSQYKMLKFSLRGIYRARKDTSKLYITYLESAIERSNWPDAEKWRKISGLIARFLLNYDPKACIFIE